MAQTGFHIHKIILAPVCAPHILYNHYILVIDLSIRWVKTEKKKKKITEWTATGFCANIHCPHEDEAADLADPLASG